MIVLVEQDVELRGFWGLFVLNQVASEISLISRDSISLSLGEGF